MIPTGADYDAVAPLNIQNSLGPPVAQIGGYKNVDGVWLNKKGEPITNPWIVFVIEYAMATKRTFAQTLKDPETSAAYKIHKAGLGKAAKPKPKAAKKKVAIKKKLSKKNVCLYLTGVPKDIDFADIDDSILWGGTFLMFDYDAHKKLFHTMIYVPEVIKDDIIAKLADVYGIGASSCEL